MLIRQTLSYLPAQLIGPLAQFATAIVLTHYLGVEDYGLTMLIIASQEFAYLVCLSWWSYYLLRYLGKLEEEGSKTRFLATETMVVIVTAMLQIGVVIGIILATEPNVSLAFYCGACAFTVSRSFLTLLSERARASGSILDYSLIQVASPIGGLLLTLLTVHIVGGKPGWVLLSFAIMQVLVGLFAAYRLKVATTFQAYDTPILRAAMVFGLPLILSGAFTWIAGNGIRFVVEVLRSPVELGLLSVGWGLATRLSAVAAQLLTAAAYPLAVRAIQNGDPDGARDQLSNNSALLVGIIAPSAFGVIAINEPLVRWLVAADFQAVTIVLLPWALIAASIRNVRMHGWDQMYLLFEKPRDMMIMEAIETVVTLLGAVIGLYYFDLLGAVIGALIATVLIAIGDYLYLRRYFQLHVPFWAMGRVLIASGIMLAAVWALPKIGLPLTPDWLSILIAIATGAVVYALCIIAFFPQFVRVALNAARTRLAGRAG